MKRLRKAICLLLTLSLLVGVFSVTLIPSATETLAATTLIVDKRGDDSSAMTGKFAPPGYILNSSPQNVRLEWNRMTFVTFDNTLKPRFTILKLDSLTRTPLANAVFNVKIKGGQDLGNFTSDANGEVIFENLDPGWYIVTETKAPAGHSLGSIT